MPDLLSGKPLTKPRTSFCTEPVSLCDPPGNGTYFEMNREHFLRLHPWATKLPEDELMRLMTECAE